MRNHVPNFSCNLIVIFLKINNEGHFLYIKNKKGKVIVVMVILYQLLDFELSLLSVVWS